MLEFSWNVFRQTGNIETYLLIKEMQASDSQLIDQQENSSEQESSEEPNL